MSNDSGAESECSLRRSSIGLRKIEAKQFNMLKVFQPSNATKHRLCVLYRKRERERQGERERERERERDRKDAGKVKP